MRRSVALRDSASAVVYGFMHWRRNIICVLICWAWTGAAAGLDEPSMSASVLTTGKSMQRPVAQIPRIWASHANERRLAHLYPRPRLRKVAPRTVPVAPATVKRSSATSRGEKRAGENLATPDRQGMVRIAAASVYLGAAGYGRHNPPRQVKLATFWMQIHEVVVSDFRACVDSGACMPPGRGGACNWGVIGRDDHPINCISAAQARAYAQYLSARDNVKYRLPRCDQWERAARDKRTTRFSWGDAWPAAKCNGCGRSCPKSWRQDKYDDGWPQTAPVTALSRCETSLTLRHLIGNVAEWCENGINSSAFDARGGSWRQLDAFLDPAMPSGFDGSQRGAHIGFRLVAD
jgi:formylglycine-generating enzyme required for sulfatase activity